MRNLSWSAVIAALLGALALGIAVLTQHDPEALVVAIVAVTFALLSHRDA